MDSELDRTWRVLLKAEKQLYKQFSTLRAALPKTSQTPQQRRIQQSRSVPKEHSHFGGLLNNLNSPVTQPRAFSHIFRPAFDLSSLTRPREVLCQPRPLARHIADLHSRSNISMPESPKKPAEPGFKSIIYLSPQSSRSHSCERNANEGGSRKTVRLRNMSQRRVEQVDVALQVQTPEPSYTPTTGFPIRPKRHFRRLQPIHGFEPSQQLDYMIREQANHRGGPRKTQVLTALRGANKVNCRLKGEAEELRKARVLPRFDEDDEDQCVIEGEASNPIVHLPKY